MASEKTEAKVELISAKEPKSDENVILISDLRSRMLCDRCRPKMKISDPADKRLWQRVYSTTDQTDAPKEKTMHDIFKDLFPTYSSYR